MQQVLDDVATSVGTGPWELVEDRVMGGVSSGRVTRETYDVRLKTTDGRRPWQSWRAAFVADPTWRTVEIPFGDFEPHRIDRPLDLSRLRRIGLLGVGRRFEVDLAVAGLALYRRHADGG